jgi:DNA-binding transcriptional ArsR family regulator
MGGGPPSLVAEPSFKAWARREEVVGNVKERRRTAVEHVVDGVMIRLYWKCRMDNAEALLALNGLANAHRLAIYRLLVQAGPEGVSAGAIAGRLGTPPSSLSFHLSHLVRTGLVRQRRDSRSLIYSADFERMNGLVGFLTENCCGGRPCAPTADLAGASAACGTDCAA